jgi:predicted ATPase
MSGRNEISRVVLRNYKSIRSCDVPLGPVTFLVGPNGAGKSNFVEALRFLSYGLSNSLESALDNRLGFRSLVHRGAVNDAMSIDVYFRLQDERTGNYCVEIGALEDGTAIVEKEACSVRGDWFKVDKGVVKSNQGVVPAASQGKLYLVNASGLAPFEPVYRALSSVLVYNPVPDQIRGFKAPVTFEYLNRLADNLAQTIFRLKASAPERLSRVIEYLQRINPGVLSVDAGSADSSYYLRFELDRGGGVGEEFQTQNISDGTLRALAILVALFQTSARYPLTLIGLEEPETGLHPAAAGVLFDSLMEASRFHQVVVTSHSPDLLDREDIPENSLKAVQMCDGRTIIGEVDEAGRSALRERLYTAGELMRMGQLRPEGVPDCTSVP